MYKRLADLEKTIGKTMVGFHKTVSILESTIEEYEGLKVEIQNQQETLNATATHVEDKLTTNNNLLNNFKGLLGI